MSGSIAPSPQAKRCTIGLLLHKVGEQGVEAVGEVGDGARRLRSGPDVTHGVHGQVHGDGAHVLGVHGDAGLLRGVGEVHVAGDGLEAAVLEGLDDGVVHEDVKLHLVGVGLGQGAAAVQRVVPAGGAGGPAAKVEPRLVHRAADGAALGHPLAGLPVQVALLELLMYVQVSHVRSSLHCASHTVALSTVQFFKIEYRVSWA
eukprot:gene5586-biopygen3423